MSKDIERLERVQKMFTRRVCRRCRINYTDYESRLAALSSESVSYKSLEYRRVNLDLSLVYKIVNNLVDLPFEDMFSFDNVIYNLRGNSLKLMPPPICGNVRSSFFSHRMVGTWNFLPDSVVTASSINSFKKKLENVDLSVFCKKFAF